MAVEPTIDAPREPAAFVAYRCNIFRRYNLQDHDATQDPLLHGEPDHPVRRHHLPDGARLLPALRFGREGHALRVDPALAHRVLPAAGGNYTPYLPGRAAAGKIPVIHDDSGDPVHMGYGVRAQRPFQVSVVRESRSSIRAQSGFVRGKEVLWGSIIKEAAAEA